MLEKIQDSASLSPKGRDGGQHSFGKPQTSVRLRAPRRECPVDDRGSDPLFGQVVGRLKAVRPLEETTETRPPFPEVRAEMRRFGSRGALPPLEKFSEASSDGDHFPPEDRKFDIPIELEVPADEHGLDFLKGQLADPLRAPCLSPNSRKSLIR